MAVRMRGGSGDWAEDEYFLVVEAVFMHVVLIIGKNASVL
jgi:hypothetical protein